MTFAQINENTFTLNNVLFLKPDLILLLECCGFEVPRSLSSEEFLEKTEYTLSTLIGDAVFDRVFADFQGYNEQDRNLWRQLVADKKVPSSN